MDTYFTEINHVLLASRGYEYDGEGHIFNVSRIMFKESFICLGGVANKRLALAQALRTDGRTYPSWGILPIVS
jgi:hypothetical protein